MKKTKKQKNDIPQFRRNLKAKAAGGAKATAGRSRVFADKKDIQAKDTGDSEIDEGIEEYKDAKPEIAPAAEIRTYYVSIGMVIGLAFDKGEKIKTGEALKKAIADNLLRNDLNELSGFIDKIELIDKSEG
jgi:hypothetical protein